VNPERGYYATLNLFSTTSAASLRAKGHSLGISIVRLDDYRFKSLDSTFINNLNAGFARARTAGVKVILRFAYNADTVADASKSRILGHLTQLAPVLQQNADVIAVMQAGFIGAWGEWHSSTNGLDTDANRTEILNAILKALPAHRAVQVRTPMFKAKAFGSTALSSSEAFSGSSRARTGHHNDCFLASSSDFGTFASPVATWKSYVGSDTQFVPQGGETCAVSAYSTCSAALADLTAQHWSYLNKEYKAAVLADWDAKGCGSEIKRRLGYRFAFKRVAHNSKVRPGGVLDVEMHIKNYGFATPFNFREIYVVLSGNGKRFTAKLPIAQADVRKWAAGTTTTLKARVRIPANLAAGTYKLGLWMPDDSNTIKNDPRYAIQLANDGAFDTVTGDNILSRNVRVDAAAPGSVSTSTTFALVP
jgi:hypothetical protein